MNLQLLEEYIVNVPGFNENGELRRRLWQSGGPGFGTSTFWMKVPMFVQVNPGERKPPFPRHLHNWVHQAEKKSRKYRANPARPTVLAVERGRLVDIAKCTPDKLMPGDGIAVTFTVSYIEGNTDWYPQYILIDIVRIERADRRGGPKRRLWAGSRSRKALRVGEVVDGECAPLGHRRASLIDVIP